MTKTIPDRDFPLMSVEDLADYLKVKPATIYGLRHRHEGPPGCRIGREIRYRRSQVDEWIEQRKDKDGRDAVKKAARANSVGVMEEDRDTEAATLLCDVVEIAIEVSRAHDAMLNTRSEDDAGEITDTFLDVAERHRAAQERLKEAIGKL